MITNEMFQTLMNRVSVLETRIAAYETGKTIQANNLSVEPADDRELDSKYGNPTIRFQSKYWEGEDFTGKQFSQCTPEFLRAHAKYLLGGIPYKMKDPAKIKYVEFDRKDAARALGWANRIEAGGVVSNDLDVMFG